MWDRYDPRSNDGRDRDDYGEQSRGSRGATDRDRALTRDPRDVFTKDLDLPHGPERRCGEMIALEWRDVDLDKRQICVQRSDWNGQVTTPKGGRLRYVPLTIRLAAAFRDHRHLRSPNVLCQDDGQPLTRQMVQYRVLRASRRAKLSQDGGHILRHTFCSHLAMRGAPPRAIQELAGHRELGMTRRYMHLSPAALESAIRLLDRPSILQSFWRHFGDGRVSEGKING
jgi:integrase